MRIKKYIINAAGEIYVAVVGPILALKTTIKYFLRMPLSEEKDPMYKGIKEFVREAAQKRGKGIEKVIKSE